MSLDFLTRIEATLCNSVISDFNILTIIQLYSEKCGPKEL